jgi:hypothetical protein
MVAPARAPLFDDTSLEAERILLERLRELGPTGRLARVAELREAALGTAMLRMRADHPDWPEHRIVVELARTWLPQDIWRRAFGLTER